ncbi:MAG: hypothetical protein ACRCVX_15260 [Shewanella sp.]
MDNIAQRRALAAIRAYFCNELAEQLREPRNWEEIYLPSDPNYDGVSAVDYVHYKNRKPYSYQLKFTRHHLTLRLPLRSYQWTIAPYVHDEQSVCPNHHEPYGLSDFDWINGKFLKRCQHQCILGDILRSTNSPYRASLTGYRRYGEAGYEQEHLTLLQQLLDACSLSHDTHGLLEWENVVKVLTIDKSVILV